MCFYMFILTILRKRKIQPLYPLSVITAEYTVKSHQLQHIYPNIHPHMYNNPVKVVSIQLLCRVLFQVFDSQTMSVTIGGEPNTIRLFDAAGI